jgi:hypothetical protein
VLLLRKTKLYLDTSVPSFLFADDSPEKREVTIKFWDVLKLEEIEILTPQSWIQEDNNE